MKPFKKAEEKELAIANACHAILEEHISNPWRWPRESDAVGSLVIKIHDLLTAKYATASVSVEGVELEKARIPRVRTEVRIQGKPWKVDVCLQKEKVNEVFTGRGGSRDILLTVKPSQIEEIVEVKLNPGRLYTDWIDDLIKLHMIRELICANEDKGCGLKSLHSLFIDTSLPLASLHSASQKPKKEPSKAKRVPVWPLSLEEDKIPIVYTKIEQIEDSKTEQTWKLNLTKCTEFKSDSGTHIYLWAIGSNPGDTPGNKIHVPACWKVEVNKYKKDGQ